MIEMHRQGSFGPTAVITNNDVLFGMASMLASHHVRSSSAIVSIGVVWLQLWKVRE
jgi:hypothetical protein